MTAKPMKKGGNLKQTPPKSREEPPELEDQWLENFRKYHKDIAKSEAEFLEWIKLFPAASSPDEPGTRRKKREGSVEEK